MGTSMFPPSPMFSARSKSPKMPVVSVMRIGRRRRAGLPLSPHRPALSFNTWVAQAKKFKTQGMISS
jgi:hypothetical protein